MHLVLPRERRHANQFWGGPVAEEDVQMLLARERENIFVFVGAHVCPGEMENIAKMVLRHWPLTGVSRFV